MKYPPRFSGHTDSGKNQADSYTKCRQDLGELPVDLVIRKSVEPYTLGVTSFQATIPIPATKVSNSIREETSITLLPTV
jgi:hypothetical protein